MNDQPRDPLLLDHEADGIKELEICTAYRCGTQTLTEMPSDLAQLSMCEPLYETVPGWSEPTKGVTEFNQLPENARRYIRRLEETSGVPASIISTGSDRDHTILRPEFSPF